jgi:GT2 family glycosyltransferase
MVTTTPDRVTPNDDDRTPSVLVVLVVRNGVPWLRECLQSLGAQTHKRLGVLAVDAGSADGSRRLLEQALGEVRVLHLDGDPGLALAVRTALELPVAGAADYLLILHDDTALAPDAVARMVEAAEGIGGVERVGVVGPKVVDWENPRILREVGRSTDRFGHPYTPLQDGEMDQGQYDRVLEVMYVSSCAMLVSHEAWQRTGPLDERLMGRHDDLDFCWRARVAGFRVLMTPLAQARHRGAGARGERSEAHRRRSPQYYAERGALAAMLKNYGILSLAWLLPLHFIMGVVRLLYLTVSRRFEDAYELLSAWTWNLVHLPSTVRRRLRAQSVRAEHDRSVRRFMESAFFRVPRWFQRAERILEEQIEEEGEEPRLRARAASLAAQHPALIAWTLTALVAALAYRRLVGPEALSGGALPAFPARTSGFFHEFVSGIRATGLGGSEAASPALAALGALSGVLFSSPAVAQKVLLMLLLPGAAFLLYRGLMRQTRQPVAAVVAAACYALSAVSLWAFSEGRLAMLVVLAVLPVVWDRLETAFGHGSQPRLVRLTVGLGAAIAIGVAFVPGIVCGVAVLVFVQLVAGRHRARGSMVALGSTAVAAALVFPVVPAIWSEPGAGLSSQVGVASFGLLGRLAPTGGAGTWPVAWFLPIAAVVALSLVGSEYRASAWRAVVVATAGIFLAWISAAGRLPVPLSNAPIYVAVSAVAEATVVAYGLATVGAGIQRQAFGYRQIAAAALTLVLTVGLGGQVFDAVYGDWAVGANGLPAAWPVISGTSGEFRVLWLGRPDGHPLPAPGGDPQGILDAGSSSVRYAITDRDGVSALDMGRGPVGSGYAYVRRVLAEVLGGDTSNGGALLAPLGVRFVVAASGDLPSAARERLGAQLDLNLIPAGGLVIYKNAMTLPRAFATSSEAFATAAASSDLARIAALPSPDTQPLHNFDGGYTGDTAGGFGFVGWQNEGGWRVWSGGTQSGVEKAFGWAVGFPAASGTLTLTYTGQWVRTVEVWVLAVLWLLVLWTTRRTRSA